VTEPAQERRLVEELTRFLTAVQDGMPEEVHGGPECRICPLCRAIGAVRSLRPEVVEHLAAAANSVIAAFQEAVNPTPPAPAGSAPTEPPVQHIDIDE
jgi:hypothetical protein